MTILLHTGPKSKPEPMLVDTTGIVVKRSEPPPYKSAIYEDSPHWIANPHLLAEARNEEEVYRAVHMDEFYQNARITTGFDSWGVHETLSDIANKLGIYLSPETK